MRVTETWPDSPAPTGGGEIGGGRGGLSVLLTVQFMGAANDNILKGLLSFSVIRGIWAGRLGDGGQGLIALCLFVPFILFSGWAGPLADQQSKRSIAAVMKIIEVPLAALAGIGFLIGNLWLTLASMVLLATQSTFFSPAKYGMIPELVPSAAVSRANGILNLATNLAVIVGMLAAGFVSDHFAPPMVVPLEVQQPLLPGMVLSGVAMAGVVAVVFLPKLRPQEPTARVPINPFASYIATLRAMRSTPFLPAAIAWGLFYLLATLSLLIVTELGDPLGVSDTAISILLAAIGVSVGFGSLLSGFLSRGSVRLDISRWGAVLLTVTFILAGVLHMNYGWTLAVFCAIGLAAGLYAVPLQSYIQVLPPSSIRGRVLATSGAISFGFMALGSLGYWLVRPGFGDQPRGIFVICGVIAAVAYATCYILPRDR